MSKELIIKKLSNIFKENFDDPTLEIDLNTTPDDIEEWDSFEQINLISAIEDEFEIKFLLEDINELKSVRKMVEYIEKNLSKNTSEG